jgi:protein-S-isoprenylcysteine O-methyltransferase Ste14
MLSIMVFFAGALIIGALSRHTFADTRSHGFFRFAAFEGLWVLLVLSAPAWFRGASLPQQILSWIFLLGALVLSLAAYRVLRNARRPLQPPKRQADSPSAPTGTLVTSGPYRHIRHPLYASLILVAWGLALKNLTFLSVVAGLFVTGVVYLAAQAEEYENLERFGERYDAYMAETRMFVPHLF